MKERGLDQSNILAADLEDCKARLADRDQQFKELLHRYICIKDVFYTIPLSLLLLFYSIIAHNFENARQKFIPFHDKWEFKGIVSRDFLISLNRYEPPNRAGSGLFFILITF
jgi:hypothetical protein